MQSQNIESAIGTFDRHDASENNISSAITNKRFEEERKNSLNTSYRETTNTKSFEDLEVDSYTKTLEITNNRKQAVVSISDSSSSDDDSGVRRLKWTYDNTKFVSQY